MSEERNHNCTAHCVCCGSHFTGLQPFDAHRSEGECREPGSVMFKGTAKRAGEPVLQALQGRCDKELGCWKDGKRLHYIEPVSIWQMSVRDTADEEQAVLL